MEVIPAIDLRDGRCVRLYQGDYDRETVFSDDPTSVALNWQEMGARRLHVVDLDGAATGVPANLEALRRICEAVSVPVQTGGGIRSLDSAARVLDMGVQRFILGTSAVEEPALVEQACRRFGAEAVVVGVDARDGMAAIRGWRETTGVSALDLIRRMAGLGVRRFVYTDISRDGTLTSPNFGAIEDIAQGCDASLVVSGGVSSPDHVERLASLGVEGVIIGRALYTGDVNLEEAIAKAESQRSSNEVKP